MYACCAHLLTLLLRSCKYVLDFGLNRIQRSNSDRWAVVVVLAAPFAVVVADAVHLATVCKWICLLWQSHALGVKYQLIICVYNLTCNHVCLFCDRVVVLGVGVVA